MNDLVLALGYFDSLHIGHRKLISSAKKYALERGYTLGVATFDDGFLQAIGRDEKEVYLLKERKELFQEIGVDEIIVFPSDEKFLSLSKSDFCAYLYNLNPKAIFVGADYRFGKGAEGDVKFLSEYGDAPVFCEDILCLGGEKVSTSVIRKLLIGGKTEQAGTFLENPFFISGTVAEGRKEGRKLNFPTVNITLDDRKIAPKYGVYATKTKVGGNEYLSVTNVGAHPTFDDEIINVESHLIDFSGDLYGKEVKISFYRYLRPIYKFDSVDELKRQITKDIITTKEYFV